MIELIDAEKDNLVCFSIRGKIEEEDVKRVADLLDEKAQVHPKIRIYAQVDELKGMSPKALLEDLRATLKHARNVEREAIVSEFAWLSAMATLTDRLFPGIEVRHFSPAERKQAMEWVES